MKPNEKRTGRERSTPDGQPQSSNDDAVLPLDKGPEDGTLNTVRRPTDAGPGDSSKRTA